MNLINAIVELEWYFLSSSAAMGIQSNFSAIRNALLNGGVSRTSVPDNMSDARVQAAERYRHINDAIHQMPKLDQDILHACYHTRQWLPETWAKFGRRSGATPFSTTANMEFDRDVKRKFTNDDTFFTWLEGVVVRGETWRSDKIQKEANELLEHAYQEFARIFYC